VCVCCVQLAIWKADRLIEPLLVNSYEEAPGRSTYAFSQPPKRTYFLCMCAGACVSF